MSTPVQFTPITAVGQTGASSATSNFYANVQSIRVWVASNVIVGINLSYNEGFDVGIGDYSGDDKILSLGIGERITALTMWPSSDGKNAAAIHISTSKGQDFKHGPSDSSKLGSAVLCPVGSGIMTGCVAYYVNSATGNDLKKVVGLGFFFFQPIRSMAVTNLEYINPPAIGSTEGVNLISLSQGTFTNNTASEIDYTFQDSVTKTTSQTYETAATQQYGASVTVSAGFLDFAKVSTTVSWSMTQETRMSSTTELEVALQWSIQGKLDGRTGPGVAPSVNCTASCWQGIISIDYTCDVTITFQDPTIPFITFVSAGTANNVLYGFVTADTDPPKSLQLTSPAAVSDTKLANESTHDQLDKMSGEHNQSNGTVSKTTDKTIIKIAQVPKVSKHGIPIQSACKS